MTTETTVDARLDAFSTSVLSDALDELGIPGALAGLSAQRQGQGRIAGRALPVRFVRKSGDPQAYRFGAGVGKPLETAGGTVAGAGARRRRRLLGSDLNEALP